MFLWLMSRGIRRNWSRSLLALAGMLLAAGVMTAAVSLRSGYAERAFYNYRVYADADVVVHRGVVGVGRETLEHWRESSWVWELRRQAELSDLSYFLPDLFTSGCLVPVGGRAADAPLELERLPQPLASLRHDPRVRSVAPLKVIPSRLVVGAGDEARVYPAPLRARNVRRHWDSWREGFDHLCTRGRAFLEQEDREGELVALVSSARPEHYPASGARGRPAQYPVPRVGDYLRVEVPAVRGYSEGFPLLDWSDTTTFELRVVGLYAVPVREGPVYDRAGRLVRDPESGALLDMPIYWETDHILIPSGTFDRIYRQVAGHPFRFTQQVGVVFRDMTQAKDIARDLGRLLPNYSVYSLPQLVKLSDADSGQMGVPADAALAIALVTYLVAGMLLITNVYTLVMQRKKEIGILKAIGLSCWQITALVVMEVGAFALAGSLLGFAGVRLVVSLVLALSEVTFVEAAVLTLTAGMKVITATTVAVLLFATVPAYRAARSTTMEVLRSE